jgi:hypothetical protein
MLPLLPLLMWKLLPLICLSKLGLKWRNTTGLWHVLARLELLVTTPLMQTRTCP